MAWITLSETSVITKLSGPEIAAMKAVALQSSQDPPLPPVISQVIKEIRGYVAANPANVLGDGETIPDELEGVAVSRIRFELATRLPVESLLTEDRRKANDNAQTLLRDVARGAFRIVPAATAAADQAAGSSAAQVISTTDRRATRAILDGL